MIENKMTKNISTPIFCGFTMIIARKFKCKKIAKIKDKKIYKSQNIAFAMINL